MNEILMCLDCIKDTKLKKYFLSKTLENGVCTFCKKSHHNCLGIDNDEFANMARALIRYHYYEVEYNRHFGGLSLTELLLGENEIFHSEKLADEVDIDILTGIIEDLRFDDNTEVALYYGHIDGIRGAFMERIKNRKDKRIEKLEAQLLEQNYFTLEDEFQRDLKSYEKYFKSKIQKKELFYRARIGYAKKEETKGGFFYDPTDEDALVKYIPYKKSEIGAPPISSLSLGRLNRMGVSYLYLATDIETALTEVRPDPGHKVSVGCFRAKQKLKIADLDRAFIAMAKNEKSMDDYRYLNHIDQILSRAITRDERHKYLVTQFVSDGFRKLGYDGIFYSSSITGGQNLLIFNPDMFEYVEYESSVYDINIVKYNYTKTGNQ